MSPAGRTWLASFGNRPGAAMIGEKSFANVSYVTPYAAAIAAWLSM